MLANSHLKKSKPRLVVIPTYHSHSTPTQHTYTDPSSPAASTTSFASSVSWVAEKSASELGSLLKSAYKSLREKERSEYLFYASLFLSHIDTFFYHPDLLLAAEIGKSLLEINQTLKHDYDTLLENVQTCESVTKNDTEMRLMASKKTYDAIIHSLERKNTEIQVLLDQAQHNSNLTAQQYERKQRKLESEIEILESNLESAANKILELEEQNKLKQEHWKRMDERRGFEQRQKSDDLELLEELTIKMQELCFENKQLQTSKKSIEEKLIVSLHDLEKLRSTFEHFEMTHQGYATLQEAFERQSTHIHELNASLEEHRHILARLKEKGLLHSTTHSIYDASESSQQSLFGELEHAFSSRSKLTKSNSESHLSTLGKMASMTERNLASFCNAPGDYALETLLSSIGIEDRRSFDEAELLLSMSSYSDDLFGPPEDHTIYAEHNLYPSVFSAQLLKSPPQEQSKGFANRMLDHIRFLFRSLFRWCRFAIILGTAVMINLWKGPDLVFEK